MENIGEFQDCMRMKEAASYSGIEYMSFLQSYKEIGRNFQGDDLQQVVGGSVDQSSTNA